MLTISFMQHDIKVEVAPGTILLDAALNNNIRIDHNCGGNCACSTCHVIIEKGIKSLSPMSDDEEDLLDEAEGLTEQSRLACQCHLTEDLSVTIPEKDTGWDDDE
ncbi:MAG: 2Fe-2S iron-sulfur cluster-binding protein [candidate division Zixibacteria bacterium]